MTRDHGPPHAVADSCEAAQYLSSAALDGPLEAEEVERLTSHLDVCGECQAFVSDLDRVRSRLRLAPVGEPPDIAVQVRARLEAQPADRSRGRPRVLVTVGQIAAVFALAFALGAIVVGSIAPPRPAIAGLSERIADAQAAVAALSAEVEIVEHGWHPEVAERRFVGRVDYGAPETLLVTLDDRTDYPDGRWRRHDVRAVVAEDHAWTSGAAPCPVVSMPGCIPWEPRVDVVEGRHPFADGAAPLDLVVPVRSFTPAAEPAHLGGATIGDRDAIGVEVTVAQAEPLLDALLSTGNWRELHRSDRVELWLDETDLVPLALTVRASDDEDRAIWATARGYLESAGDDLIEVRFTDVRVNDEAGVPTVPPAPEAAARDAGFRGAVEVPDHVLPAWLPDGMEQHRVGSSRPEAGPQVAVASWSDGRAWLVVRAADGWAGARLFGDLGQAVRRLELGEGGVAYLGDGGRRVALHTDDVDVVVEGSVPTDVLVEVARSLPLVGTEVPDTWAEATLATLDEAAAQMSGLLVPDGLDGFSEPSVRIEQDTAVLAYQGPGARGFVLVRSADDALSPPMDADVRGVVLRGTTARYTPARGELEWVEDGAVVTLRSTSLGLEELVGIAETLRPHRPEAAP